MAAEHVHAIAPVTEVREGNDALAADTQHFTHDIFAAAHRLQRLREDHVVERIVRERRQSAFHIALDYVNAVSGACQHAVVVDLHAIAYGVALLGEKAQQRAVAATKIQNTGAGFDPVGDRCKIGALHRVGIHAVNPAAMRSK